MGPGVGSDAPWGERGGLGRAAVEEVGSERGVETCGVGVWTIGGWDWGSTRGRGPPGRNAG